MRDKKKRGPPEIAGTEGFELTFHSPLLRARVSTYGNKTKYLFSFAEIETRCKQNYCFT